jgi:hypothetical protein
MRLQVQGSETKPFSARFILNHHRKGITPLTYTSKEREEGSLVRAES